MCVTGAARSGSWLSKHTARHGTACNTQRPSTRHDWFFVDVCAPHLLVLRLVLGFIVPAACVAAAAGPGLSTYMPLRKEPPLISESNLKTPIFQAHGDMDSTVGRGMGPLADCLHGLCCVQQV